MSLGVEQNEDPKHAFISWMVALGKLETRERLKQVGQCPNVECLLCCNGMHSCKNMFFHCTFSDKVCQGIVSWLQI